MANAAEDTYAKYYASSHYFGVPHAYTFYWPLYSGFDVDRGKLTRIAALSFHIPTELLRRK